VLVMVTTVVAVGDAVVAVKGSTPWPTCEQKLVNQVCSSVRSDSAVLHSEAQTESGVL
jgi:hypothetical protein